MSRLTLSLATLALLPALLPAEQPLHTRIDALIDAAGKGKPRAAQASEAEFLRRVYLDLAGMIPTAEQARAFLKDRTANKREKLIDKLLASAEYSRRMQELFNVILMERLGDHPAWTEWLTESFAKNKPWDQMTREILRATPGEKKTQGAAFFIAKRVEQYGQNPIDHAGLTRDVGRLFLGKDYRCAQCHDHLFIDDYKQAHFQGLHSFLQHTYVYDITTPTVAERVVTQKTAFMSVFAKVKMETGPRLPGGKEISIPMLTKATFFVTPPSPKTRFPGVLRFSPLAELAKELPVASNADFNRNIVNRLWWAMMGRGLVHPLDLHHSRNPPSHPAVLALLAREFAARKYDIKYLLRELALTRVYQRSSELPAGVKKIEASTFLIGLEKRLSAEQLMWATLQATGEYDRTVAGQKATPKGKKPSGPLVAARAAFVRAYANGPRDPEDEINPSLRGALFLLNGSFVVQWLTPRTGNLIDRAVKLTDTDKIAEELYLSVLTRLPDDDEKQEVAKLLKDKPGKQRTQAIMKLAWALVASTEFSVNH